MAKYKLSRVIFLFKKFGGVRLLCAYARIGILWTALKEGIKGLLKRKPFDEIYYTYQPQIVDAIKKQYRPLIKKRLLLYEKQSLPHDRMDIIWFCWLQGIENAPKIIRICLESIRENLPHKEIRIIDDKNRHQYVSFPRHVENKWKKKQVPPALFADLLRLELLIKYGGTWIDSTILCTGKNFLKESLDSDLFFYQFKRSAESQYIGISNWFITSCQNNPLLMSLRDCLYAYWEDYNCVLEYFVFHRLFDLIAEERPIVISRIPYAYSPDALVLGHNLGRIYNKESWERLVSKVAFHKLTYKIADDVKNTEGNYYHHVLNLYNI